MDTPSILAVDDLRVELPLSGAWVPAVDGVSLRISAGERVAVAGESGCGKTLLAKALIGLTPEAARVTGSVLWKGEPLGAGSDRAWKRIRGAGIGFVFQEPAAALDPVRTIGEQVAEAIRIRGGVSPGEARALAIERLAEVSFPDPERGFSEYPHRLSGGQKQRALIAAALAADPELLIADEPTSALDATVAADVMDLLGRLRTRRGLALLLISHDLGLVARHSDRALILYAGRVVEEAPTAAIATSAKHPYTQGLLRSAPRLVPSDPPGRRFEPIPGAVPDLAERGGRGCAFAPRCPDRFDPCDAAEPPLFSVAEARARCFLYGPAPVVAPRAERGPQ